MEAARHSGALFTAGCHVGKNLQMFPDERNSSPNNSGLATPRMERGQDSFSGRMEATTSTADIIIVDCQ